MSTDVPPAYDQSIPLEWLQYPQERDRTSLLEFVRGVLISNSRRESGQFEPVHSSKIQNSFKRLGSQPLHKVGLRLLELFREAEPLLGGFWLPAPFRVLQIGGEYAFVGATPTSHGLLGEVRVEGMARLVAPHVADRFPIQSLDAWMGARFQNAADAFLAFATNHAINAFKTAAMPDVLYLTVVPESENVLNRIQWVKRPVAAIPRQQIAVCMQLQHGRARYFSATLSNGKPVSEAPLNMAISRLLFAIASHAGTPVVAQIRSSVTTTQITVNERIPTEEFRLALLLSKHIHRAGRSTTFLLDTTLAPAFISRLADLGCSMETMR